MKKRKSKREKSQELFDSYIRQFATENFQKSLRSILNAYDRRVTFWKCACAVAVTIYVSNLIIIIYG
jgi:hypothetical protein